MRGFPIGGRLIGPGHAAYVIAEAGVNHGGDVEKALRLVDVAADAGADAVKFQTFSAARLVSADAAKAAYQKKTGPWRESQRDMLEKLELDEMAHMKIRHKCRDREIEFLSSPFDEEAADFLEEIGIKAFKVASGEITNLPFLGYLGGKGLPLILSTGTADMAEVAAAVETLRSAGAKDIALLHCVSAYPAEPADCNLSAMKTLADTFQAPVGWSDHTLGWEVTVAAAAMGANVIEKHLTFDADALGPDHRVSLEPIPFAAMVAAVRAVESAIGDGVKTPRDCEKDVAMAARKSLVAARDLRAGENLAREDIAARRPGDGLSPATLDQWVGRKLNRDVGEGALLTPDMFD